MNVLLTFFSLKSLDSIKLVCFADAGFGNLPVGGSQGGYLIFCLGKNKKYCLLAWQSRRIRRVVKSTLAAECLIAVEAAEHCVLLSRLLKEVICIDKIDVIQYSNNKSLVDAVHSTTSIEDKRLRIDVATLREMLHGHELSKFDWVCTKKMIAIV